MCCNKSQAKSAFVSKWGLRLLHDQRDVLRGQTLDEIEHENTSPNKYKDLKEIIGASSLKEFAQFRFQTPKIGSITQRESPNLREGACLVKRVFLVGLFQRSDRLQES